MRAFLRDTLVTIIIAAVIIFGLQTTVQKFVIDGPSMNPDFHDGQRLLVNKAVYKLFHEPERGDVIIFHPPQQSEDAIPLIKRIIGLPGESVEIKEGIVYIHKEDGSAFALDEPYITEPAWRPFKGDTITENHFFVLGDNRNNSGDSRSGWLAPRQNIIGKVWLSVWPPDIWGLAVDYSYEREGSQ